MSVTILTCKGCRAALRIKHPSPAGRLIRCPTCRIVFKAPADKPSESIDSLRDDEINCTDCGATLRSDEPLLPGQLAQCPECTTIFRLPNANVRQNSPSGDRSVAQYFEPWTPLTKEDATADSFRQLHSGVIRLKLSVYGVKLDPPIEAELLRPWDSLPDEIAIEQERQRRHSRQQKHRTIFTTAICLALCLGVATALIIVSRMRKDAKSQSAEATEPAKSAVGSSTPGAGKGTTAKRLEADAGERADQSKLPPSRATRQQVSGFADGQEGKIQLHSAIGFAVAPGGYILTTASAVRDPEAIAVRILNCDELPSARVTAVDEQHNLALIRIRIPDGAVLEPLPLNSQTELQGGDAVGSFRSSSAEAQGDSLKMALGLITAPAEQNVFSPFEFDVTDSSAGAPVCDARGNVVGMTTMPGSAFRARDLSRFLQDHIEGFRPITYHSQKKEWQDIEKMTRASVVLVLGHK